jgi:sulfur carrier protein ThiS adenylyltransferase
MEQYKFEQKFYSRNPEGVFERLKVLTIGIAGAGGLGSNIAASLVRTGVQNIIIADFDKIEYSNLNRQFFFPDQVGQYKVDALKENLLRINPFIKIKTFSEMVMPENVKLLFNSVDIMVEAFDRAEMKAMLVHNWLTLHPDRYIVTATGLAGFGNSNTMQVESRGKVVICGDRESSPERSGLTAPRVAIAAAMQANAVVEIAMR